MRGVLGEPQSRRGSAQFPAPAVLVAEVGEGLLGAFGLAEAHQGLQQPCPHYRNEVVRRSEMPGQPLGGLEGGQRVGVPAARQLDEPADEVDPHPHRRLGFCPDGALGALDPALGLLQPPLPRQYRSEYHVGVAGGRLAGPAMLFGQLDRLPAALCRPGKRPPGLGHRLVRQAGELQIRPPDPVRQGDALFEVPIGLFEASGPQFGDAEVDQRQRPQVLVNPQPR